jgi:hypothetical protein
LIPDVVILVILNKLFLIKKKVTHVQKPHGDIIDDIVTNLDIANQIICYEAYKYTMTHPKNLS